MKNTLIITAIIILSSLHAALMAQTTLTGKVTDAEKDEPIPYATVYIDGTSIGTITDESGAFTLNDVHPPAKLVVSHLSYRSAVFLVDSHSAKEFNIVMQAKMVDINQLQVDASDNRAKNLERFKKRFLGTDYWGQNAVILNDSVLVFRKEYEEKKVKRAGRDTIKLVESLFLVRARSTLIIDMPKLGYTLYADLSYYRETPGRTTSYGYYYYKPYEDVSRLKQRKITKNRRKVYYNSPQHFFRALHAGTLMEEGYAICYQNVLSFMNVKPRYHSASILNIDTCVVAAGESVSAVLGKKDAAYAIDYYFNSSGKPINLNAINDVFGKPYSRSAIYFTRDSCAFSKDGIIPGNGIVLDGALARKRTGASLPRDYEVED